MLKTVTFVITCLLLLQLHLLYSFPLQSFSYEFRVDSRLPSAHGYSGVFVKQKETIAMMGLESLTKTTYYMYNNFWKVLKHDNSMECVDPRKNIENILFPLFPTTTQQWNNSITPLNAARIFDKEVAQCKFNKYIFKAANQVFVLCFDESSQNLEKIIGKHVVVSLKPSVQNRLTQKMQQEVNTQCFSKENQVVSIPLESSNSIEHWFEQEASCQYSWMRNEAHCASTNIIKPTKRCIFLHGVGQTEAEKGPPVANFSDYWGKLNDFTPQCLERVYIREETKVRGWDNADLQKSYCSVALEKNQTDTVIRNAILFVHSMGNLILAAAIKNNICSIDVETTSWYEIQGPFGGSKASDTLKDICLKTDSHWYKPTPEIYYYLAEVGGYCIEHTNQSYWAYQTLAPSYPGIQDLAAIAAPLVKGSMCGISAYGLNSHYAPLLSALSIVVQYGTLNDGMVPIHGCMLGKEREKLYSNDYKKAFYVASINHADGTCRDGDSWFSEVKQPCAWFTNKV